MTDSMDSVDLPDLKIRRLGEPQFDSPLRARIEAREPRRALVPGRDRILFRDVVGAAPNESGFELAGARKRLFFDPTTVRAGIVTCGGLCPGLNDVIRGLTLVLRQRYGVQQVDGFRYGYRGLTPESLTAGEGFAPIELTESVVDAINDEGGSILGTSRGPQDLAVMVDFLVTRGTNALFVIGGDGTLRGARAIADEVQRRGLPIAVVGLPKTIDNDIRYVEQSFGFQTAFTEATRAIQAAHTEARSSVNGCGIVKLMGRHSGFIAAHATLASGDVNVALIPEVDFALEGPEGLLPYLEHRMIRRRHAVVVVAEGAGQAHLNTGGADASGNVRLGDIGTWLQERISNHFQTREIPLKTKYIDPSYQIRGLPATAHDSVYCYRLASHAVHAAMAGFTRMVVGRWHGRFVHLPIDLCVSGRQTVDPHGDLWLSVMESTGQPAWPEAQTLH